MSQSPPEQRTDGQQPTVQRGGLWGVFFAVLGLVVPVYGLPLSIVGILQGRRVRRNAREHSSQAPGAVPSIVLGWLGVVLWGTSLIAAGTIRTELTDWTTCLERANTVSVERQCDEKLRTDLEGGWVPEPVISELVGR